MPATGAGRLLCFAAPRPSGPSIRAMVPVSQATAFRAANPGAYICRPDRPSAAPAFDGNKLLDISSDGTFSGARRAATLGHQDPALVMSAIGGLARAAENGTVSAEFAAAKITALADPPLAAAQAGERVQPLTPLELAIQRERRASGASDSELLTAQALKLRDQCLPHVCFMEGVKKTGEVKAQTFATITPEEAMAKPGFIRFCNAVDLQRLAGPRESWGDWFTGGLRRAAADLGLANPPDPRTQSYVLTGAPVPPEGSPTVPPDLSPIGSYIMRSPDNKIVAVVPAREVPAKLAAGWTLAT